MLKNHINNQFEIMFLGHSLHLDNEQTKINKRWKNWLKLFKEHVLNLFIVISCHS